MNGPSTADINCSPTTIYGDMFGERSDSSVLSSMPSGSSMMSPMSFMLPVPDDGEMIMEEGEIDIVKYSPPDVVIPEADVLSEDEIYAVSGIDAESETINDSEMYSEIETIPPEIDMTDESSVETSNDDNGKNQFQMFVEDLISKRWTRKDIDDFVKNIRQLSLLTNNEISYDDKLGMMTNPEFRSMAFDMVNKLNTINIMIGMNNNCNINAIIDPNQQQIIRKQSHIMATLVNVYKPMLIRLNFMIDRLTTDLNVEQNVDANIHLDESVLNDWVTLRTGINKLLESVKTRIEMNKMNKMNKLNKMNKMNETERSVEPFVEHCNDCESTGNYFITLCVIVLLGLLIYMLFYRK